jgi:beta-glucosidase
MLRAASPTPSTSSPEAPALPFANPGLPREARIEDLVRRLTLPEKISQLVHESSAVSRLDVPAYNWWSEACHGVGRNGRATVFPQVIGLSASWNRTLVEQVASAVADEARAKHHAALSVGRRDQYQGLTFWTPNINIFRDPRWGRGQETYGEDPYLTGELGLCTVRGLQGDDGRYLKVAACAKHFAVHSGPEAERHGFDARPNPKDLAETYLPAFEKLVHGGVEAVMGAYNRVLGEPACGSKFLLADLLRGRWGFRGHVVSDCGAIDDFHQHHKVTANAAESAALAVRNGCDLNCGCTYNDLLVAVKDGLVTEAEIDNSLRRLLATRFKLGLFDPPSMVHYASTPMSVVESPAHRALARQAAVESIVLLKNRDNILPLPKNPASMLVVGPTAGTVSSILGNYFGVSSRMVTLVEGITDRLTEGVRMEYRVGVPLAQPYAEGTNYTFPTAASCEYVVACLGIDPTLEGEEGDAVASYVGGDRQIVELPENQRAFLRELRKHAKKLILVLTGGSALAITEEHEYCDAVLQIWYPGCEGGRALADVLFGDVSPSGRMPVTVPKSTSDLPPFNDYSMRGRTYKFSKTEPLYPFGFGLGYAQVSYGKLQLGAPKLSAGQKLSVKVTVSNRSAIATNEVVQCYLQPPQTWADAPQSCLVEFRKVALPANGSAEVEFSLGAEVFRQVDASGNRVIVPGNYGIVVGPASPGQRALALGAPAPATAAVEIV